MDGRRAIVVLPNDPELVDILARNGVDISVSEGEQQGNYVALLGNLLFPLIAFAGLFLLFRRAGDGSVSGRPALPVLTGWLAGWRGPWAGWGRGSAGAIACTCHIRLLLGAKLSLSVEAQGISSLAPPVTLSLPPHPPLCLCQQGGGMGGPMGGPLDFARNKSKFQEIPETGVTFVDVAVRGVCPSALQGALVYLALQRSMPRPAAPLVAIFSNAELNYLVCIPGQPLTVVPLDCPSVPPACRAATRPSWSWWRWLTS